MKIGTRSILFGAHQFLIHPLFVALAWWRLYGFPWDPRLWVAFLVHDLGYWGKPNMDGPEGEDHPRLGASIMGKLFDRDLEFDFLCPHPQCEGGYLTDEDADAYVPPDGAWPCPVCERQRAQSRYWHDFTLYHSRFIARRNDRNFSRLCVADKLAGCLEPDWFYLGRVILSGEIHEYMSVAMHKEGKYRNESIEVSGGRLAWRRSVKAYLLRWIEEQRDRALI